MKDDIKPKREESPIEYLKKIVQRQNETYHIFVIVWLIMLFVGVGLGFLGLILVAIRDLAK